MLGLQSNVREKRWVAELLGDKAPKLCQAILNALPLEGPVTNMHTSGEIMHYWAVIPGTPEKTETIRERLPVGYQGREIGSSAVAFYAPRDNRGTNPGDILFNSVEGIRIVHGQVQNDQTPYAGLSRGSGWTQKVGRIIEGAMDELREIAESIDWEGAQTMRVTRA